MHDPEDFELYVPSVCFSDVLCVCVCLYFLFLGFKVSGWGGGSKYSLECFKGGGLFHPKPTVFLVFQPDSQKNHVQTAGLFPRNQSNSV